MMLPAFQFLRAKPNFENWPIHISQIAASPDSKEPSFKQGRKLPLFLCRNSPRIHDNRWAASERGIVS